VRYRVARFGTLAGDLADSRHDLDLRMNAQEEPRFISGRAESGNRAARGLASLRPGDWPSSHKSLYLMEF
jgi:hypothetical protein